MKDSSISKLVHNYFARGRGNVGHQEKDGQTNTHEDGTAWNGIYVAADYVAGWVSGEAKGKDPCCAVTLYFEKT
jgi:hypothetical protein